MELRIDTPRSCSVCSTCQSPTSSSCSQRTKLPCNAGGKSFSHPLGKKSVVVARSLTPTTNGQKRLSSISSVDTALHNPQHAKRRGLAPRVRVVGVTGIVTGVIIAGNAATVTAAIVGGLFSRHFLGEVKSKVVTASTADQSLVSEFLTKIINSVTNKKLKKKKNKWPDLKKRPGGAGGLNLTRQLDYHHHSHHQHQHQEQQQHQYQEQLEHQEQHQHQLQHQQHQEQHHQQQQQQHQAHHEHQDQHQHQHQHHYHQHADDLAHLDQLRTQSQTSTSAHQQGDILKSTFQWIVKNHALHQGHTKRHARLVLLASLLEHMPAVHVLDFLKGGHVHIIDQGAFYRHLTAAPGSYPRISSHYGDHKSAPRHHGLTIILDYIVIHMLAGVIEVDGEQVTWVQLESSPMPQVLNPTFMLFHDHGLKHNLIGLYSHATDWVAHRYTKRQYGPLGTSEYTEKGPEPKVIRLEMSCDQDACD